MSWDQQHNPYQQGYGYDYNPYGGQQQYAQQPYPQQQQYADYGYTPAPDQTAPLPPVVEPEPVPEQEPAPVVEEPRPESAPAPKPKPAGRDRYFDTLRAVALIRVVTYHTFGWAWCGMIFPSMGIMFGLAGTLMAKSLERPALKVVKSRLRRLLPPFWFWGLFVVLASLRCACSTGSSGAGAGPSADRRRAPAPPQAPRKSSPAARACRAAGPGPCRGG